jgi:putative transposase
LWRRLHPNAKPALDMNPWPVPQPAHWTKRVNQPLSEAELAAIRRALVRGSPFGPERWQKQIAGRLGLQYTLRARGRPKKLADGPALF